MLTEEEESNERSENDDEIQQKNESVTFFPPKKKKLSKRSIATMVVLVYINFLNYMDRYTLSSVLPQIQSWFHNISDETAGLLQTVFVCSYMVFAPLFGYLGDRFSRKLVMAVGVSIWIATTFCGSLVDKNHFYLFFILRGLVGIGEASYSTLSPTIIADLFVGDARSKALSIFYFALPCGSGLGYIVGSKVSSLMGGWQWAMRVTPVLGLIGVVLLLFVSHEPKRGMAELASENQADIEDFSASLVVRHKTSYIDDLKTILVVPSFVLSTLGNTCFSLVAGGMAWWMPKFITFSEIKLIGSKDKTIIKNVSLIFGIVTFLSGVIGVWMGAELARRWRKYNPKADALVCGFGLLVSAPLIYVGAFMADIAIAPYWVITFLAEVSLFLNYSPNNDILLYVTPANCRATAQAIQLLVMHILGDAFSPFLIGFISDMYVNSQPVKTNDVEQLGLKYSLYVTPFVVTFGALFYFICGNYLIVDREKAKRETETYLRHDNDDNYNDSIDNVT